MRIFGSNLTASMRIPKISLEQPASHEGGAA
jgi:hypothetical protein